MKLHIGGHQPHPDWKILNIDPGPHVDFVGDCTDLSRFADASVAAIYASHTFEHLGHRTELPHVLAECRRILVDGGELMISVPDFEVLARIFLEEGQSLAERVGIMRLIFGGQKDAHDFHKVGLTHTFLIAYLNDAGFHRHRRVETFELFDDASRLRHKGRLISLNMIATK